MKGVIYKGRHLFGASQEKSNGIELQQKSKWEKKLAGSLLPLPLKICLLVVFFGEQVGFPPLSLHHYEVCAKELLFPRFPKHENTALDSRNTASGN